MQGLFKLKMFSYIIHYLIDYICILSSSLNIYNLSRNLCTVLIEDNPIQIIIIQYNILVYGKMNLTLKIEMSM